MDLAGKMEPSKKKKIRERMVQIIKNLFSVYNEFNNSEKYKVVKILGLKIKCKISFKKYIRKFVVKNDAFLDRAEKDKTRRLFLTTGNLSLINNITIIKQLATENCEDSLLILSNLVNPKFYDTCKQVAKLHDFKEIYCYNEQEQNLIEYVLKNELTDYDEIYFSNQYQFINVTHTLYPNAKWIITDEGCGGKLARLKYCNYDNVEKMIMHKYLGKLDFFGLQARNWEKIVPLSMSIFKEVCRECEKMYPITLKQTKDDKSVIFCGSWYEVSGLSKDEYMQLQDSIIEHLITNGYKIFFKPHPRDPRNYINNQNVTILNTALPIECYDLDVVAIISVASSSPLHMINAYNLPGFTLSLVDRVNKPFELKWLSALERKLMADYTPPIEEILSVDARLYTKDELKKILQEKCQNYINSKLLLSENEEFRNYAVEKGYVLENEYEDVKC